MLDENRIRARVKARIVLMAADGAATTPELLSVGWAESSLRHLLVVRTASFWTDLCVFFVLHTHLSRIIALILTFGRSLFSFGWLHDRLADATGFRFGLDSLPRAPQFLIAFFIYSFLDYWNHRIQHMRVLWPLHWFHHAAEEFTIFTSTRFHPADVSPIFVLTGPLVAPDVLAAVLLFRNYIGWIQHSKIGGDGGRFGRWVIYSPASHRMHRICSTIQNQRVISPWFRSGIASLARGAGVEVSNPSSECQVLP
jgi:sterol desaturase/sphingolipid hydroxylase (fatty acid hydroxylase superfamily)